MEFVLDLTEKAEHITHTYETLTPSVSWSLKSRCKRTCVCLVQVQILVCASMGDRVTDQGRKVLIIQQSFTSDREVKI